MRSLVQKCLQKDKARRLHDVADARIELEDALAAMPASSPIGAAGAAGGAPGVRDSAWTRAVAALALLAAAYGSFAPGRRRRGLPPGASRWRSLPFHVVGGASAPDDLGLGLADDIITHLANTAELRVRPTQAVLRYQANPPEPQEAGRRARRGQRAQRDDPLSAGGTRATAQLARVADGRVVLGRELRPRVRRAARPRGPHRGEVAQALGCA